MRRVTNLIHLMRNSPPPTKSNHYQKKKKNKEKARMGLGWGKRLVHFLISNTNGLNRMYKLVYPTAQDYLTLCKNLIKKEERVAPLYNTNWNQMQDTSFIKPT